MRLSRKAYLADFVIYPFAVVLVAAAGLSVSASPVAWLLTCAAGIALWTLVEYLLHRFVFHHVPLIERMHEAHHDEPRALIGSPAWLSLMIFAFGVAPPLWLAVGPVPASALLAGLMTGYFWYMVVHHAVHHWAINEGSWLYAARLRHQLHHYRSPQRSFGVTTEFWDHVFGTAQEPRRAKPRMPA